MTPTTWRTLLTRTAALGALSVALTSTLAAAPASAGPLEDLLTAIDTGSAGSSIPGPSAPPTGEPHSDTFTVTTGPRINTVAQVQLSCGLEVKGSINGQPLSTLEYIPPNSVTRWTVTRDASRECPINMEEFRIQYKKIDTFPRVSNPYAYIEGSISWSGEVGYQCVYGQDNCIQTSEGVLVRW